MRVRVMAWDVCVCERERESVRVCVWAGGLCAREITHLFEQVNADNVPAARKGQ